MGFLDRLFGTGAVVASADAMAESFAVDADAIDPAVFGLTSYTSTTARAPRIDRATAMQVPAVKRTRDLICSSSGALPLGLFNRDGAAESWSLFDQPEKSVPRSVTMARTFEDLLFEGVAWWRVTDIGFHGYPTFVQHLTPGRVQVNAEHGTVHVDGKAVANPAKDLIRFDSPNDALLIAGARAIRTCLALDAAAANMADGVPPADYFTPGEGMDPGLTDADIIDMLDRWQTARRSRSTGYVPAALEYHNGGFSPEQLQLADARQHAVLEIARVGGVDPEELGVSTTSRTYSSDWSRRKAFLDFTLGAYLNAVEDRLIMADVTPRGYAPAFDLDAFLRTDTLTRYQTYDVGLRVGAITPDEVRAAEGKAPLLTAAPSPIRAVPDPQENTA